MAKIHYTRLLGAVVELPRKQLEELDSFIHALLAQPEKSLPTESQAKSKGAKGKGRAVIQQRGAVTLRVEYRKCGKNCRCNNGKGHGPYLYAYWWEEGRTRSKYLGRAG